MTKALAEKIIKKDLSSRPNVHEQIQKKGWDTVVDELTAFIDYMDRDEIEEALFEYLKL